MRANVVKTVVNSVPHEGIDAVGVERTIPENPLRRKKTHLFLGGYINLIVLLAFRLTGYALFQLVTA